MERPAPNDIDPSGDASADGDISAFYWGTNPNDETVYLMIERYAGSTANASYTVYLDMNNNGNYTSTSDRFVIVAYTPRVNDSRVTYTVYDGAGSQISQYSNLDYGESQNEGARRVEIGVSFGDLGFTAGIAVRMYVTSQQGDRAPDAGDVQWSPVPGLGYLLLAAFVGIGAFIAWRRKWGLP